MTTASHWMGDGDRLGVVTKQGEIIFPDRLMMLFAEDILKHHPGEPIVYDVKCSRKLVDWVKAKEAFRRSVRRGTHW